MFARFINYFLGSKAQQTCTFQFHPRWKEELVVTGPGGSFILELPMGIYSAWLPTHQVWLDTAPEWAKDLWPILKEELEDWCRRNKAKIHIDEKAWVGPMYDQGI